jgi:hypothetical protein
MELSFFFGTRRNQLDDFSCLFEPENQFLFKKLGNQENIQWNLRQLISMFSDYLPKQIKNITISLDETVEQTKIKIDSKRIKFDNTFLFTSLKINKIEVIQRKDFAFFLEVNDEYLVSVCFY